MTTPTLEQMRGAWEAVARYRVFVKEPGKADVPIGAGLAYSAARDLAKRENERLAAQPGFRNVMSRPIAGIELENPIEAAAASRARLAALGVAP